MGGYGSGRHGRRPNARALTDDRQRLDVCALRRAGWRREAGEGDDDGAAIVLRVEGAPAYTCRPVEPGAALEGGPAAPAGACAIGRLEGAAPPVRVAIDWRRVGYGWRPWWICPRCRW